MLSWWLLLRWAHWRKLLVGTQVVSTWCIIHFTCFCVISSMAFQSSRNYIFFPSWLDKPLQTSNLLPEPQVTQLLDRAECRISSLIPRNIDNPEFSILSEISNTESCMLWGTWRVFCRHEAIPRLCLDLICWNCLESCFCHTKLYSVSSKLN